MINDPAEPNSPEPNSPEPNSPEPNRPEPDANPSRSNVLGAADEGFVRRVAQLIRDAHHVVVLTGAGLSTESGIRDFRGPDGVWTKDPDAEKYSDIRYYAADPEIRKKAWRHRYDGTFTSAQPNTGHRALSRLATAGHLATLITQNIDGLHQAAGYPAASIVEIHGTVQRFTCLSCGNGGPIQRVIDRLDSGEDDPPCLRCGGILKSATISFGQSLNAEDLERSHRAAQRCDLFLALGTSLTVYPVAALPEIAVRSGAKLVVANGERTAYDSAADEVSHARLGPLLSAIASAVLGDADGVSHGREELSVRPGS